MKALLFAGTSEGRIVANALAANGADALVSFATEYGFSSSGLSMYEPGENDQLQGTKAVFGRLDEGGIAQLIRTLGFSVVVDATHPYASSATENIKAAAESCSIKYIRVARSIASDKDAICFGEPGQAARFLSSKSGNVLLTTGANSLEAFASLGSRVYARMLASEQSIQKARALGIGPAQLILMQGPFTEEMNLACLSYAKAAYMVTKASGESGGFGEKISAAEKYGAVPVIIAPPAQEDGVAVEKALEMLGIAQSGEQSAIKQPKSMFPVFINLGGMKALLVGGGNVALRRAGSLSAFSAAITVIAINACDGIKGMANSGLVSLQERAYEQGDESGFDICIAATNDARLNSEIALRAKSNGTRYYNDSSNSQNSNFFFPALVHKGAVTIGIASDGGHDSHLLVSETASRLRALLNEV